MNYPISNPVTLIFVIIGGTLAIKHTIFLFIKQSEKNIANKYLGSLILCFSIFYINAFLFRFDLLIYAPHIIGLQSFTHFLIGPLIYLYVRACTEQDFKMSPTLFLHFVPFIIDLALGIPYLIQSGAEKLQYYNLFITDGALRGSRLLILSKSIHGTIYFFLALALVKKYRSNLSNTASYIDEVFHRWLVFYVVISSLPIIFLLNYTFLDFNVDYSKALFAVGCTIFLIVVDIAMVFKPEIFQTFPQRLLSPTIKTRYEHSNLEDSQKEKYLEQLKSFLSLNKTYKEPELTLAKLSEQLDIPPHYLSQVINEKLGTNFLDYINRHRIDHAKTQLINPEMEHYTIMAIAYDSGFNSKSTFYSAFKKYTGQTPSQYKKAQLHLT